MHMLNTAPYHMQETRLSIHPIQSYSAQTYMGSTGSAELSVAVRKKNPNNKTLLILRKHFILPFLNRAEASRY